ncbi:complex I subunit 5 family protein [Azohydromonas aeria]|uniref:complex I subunit 5 family protein n=1 Tax=Azohydromonas aeria TaxID=2590212 RepID=UPI0012FC2866|nr:complex I subunit 5 family protein [Azohydromonas aeria]
MAGWSIALAVTAPWLLLALAARLRRSDALRPALPLASLAALAPVLWPGEVLDAPWLLLGLRLAADELARTLLLLIGIAWSAAAWYAGQQVGERFRAFALYWLATLAGIVLAALAADLATFYTGYVVMTLASYGLVVHGREPAALRAGRIYLVLALLGEALLLSGLLWIGSRLGNAALATLPQALQGRDAAVAAVLLLGGFGVKIGVVPLHVWLPVAHPVAPVPASAILSGVLVKAGLLGALRLVPAEPFAAPGPVAALMALGLFTAFYGVAVGLAQPKLKTVLAYSTVSQMGLLFTAMAATLAPGAARGGALITLLVLHHGLNKAALFLAAGSAPGATRVRLALLALPALALVGLPLTSGALAKDALKSALGATPLGDAAVLWLALSSLATALLMLRVFHLARAAPADAGRPALHSAWPLLVLAGVVLPWWLAWRAGSAKAPDLEATFASLWPALLALALFLAWQRLGAPGPRRSLPEGDLLQPAAASLRALSRLLRRAVAVMARLHDSGRSTLQERLAALDRALASLVRRTEASFSTLPWAGVLVLSLTGLLYWAVA